MDNAYRFGQISVSCEGFAFPEDLYIVKGSYGVTYCIVGDAHQVFLFDIYWYLANACWPRPKAFEAIPANLEEFI